MLQNFIELLTIPFGAGESRLLHVSGQYFEIIDAPSPIDVLLLDENGTQRGIMRGAEASFHLKNTKFSTIQITSAAAQTVRIGYGSGEAGTRRAAGSVNIANQPTVTIDANQLLQLVRPMTYGASFDSTAALAAAATEQVFAAAANVNGCIVHAASWNGFNAGTGITQSALIAAAAAPGTFTAGDVLMHIKRNGSVAGGVNYSGELDHPIVVPAGRGLWFFNQALESAGARRVLYTLL